MPELDEHATALGMNRVCDALPARDLFVTVDSRRAPVAAAGRRDRRRLREDESAVRGALTIVLEVQITWHSARPLGAEAAQGGHHNAVFERDRADLDRGE